MSQLNNHRYERKFVLDSIGLSELMPRLNEQGFVFKSAYPDRYINSVYFDTPNLRYGYENLDGVGSRTKVRVRWYGQEADVIDKLVLEIKTKEGLLGDKQHYMLGRFDKKKNLNTLVQRIRSADIPSEVRLLFSDIAPVVCVKYKRKYFVSRDGRFRMTYDDNIRYFNAGNGYMRGVGYGDKSDVLELKYAKDHDKDADRISNCFPFRLNKNSKYVNALKATHDLRL